MKRRSKQTPKMQHLPAIFLQKYLNWAQTPQRLHCRNSLMNHYKITSFLTNWNWQTLHQYLRKKTPLGKANYRPVSALPTISKIYEKLLRKQINNYIENILSPYLCGYRKGYSTQHALICLIEKWKKVFEEQC